MFTRASIRFIYSTFFVLCLAWSGTTYHYSRFADSNTFIENYGVDYSMEQDGDEYSAHLNKYKTPSNERSYLSVNADWQHRAQFSPFIFTSYFKNHVSGDDYVRFGLGAAYIPDHCQYDTIFPYYSKYSVAAVYEVDRGFFISQRLKFRAKVQDIMLKATMFWLGFSETSDVKLSYKVSKQVKINWAYKYERIDSYKNAYNTLGLEVKL